MSESLGETQRKKREAAIEALREAMRAYERDTGKVVAISHVDPDKAKEIPWTAGEMHEHTVISGPLGTVKVFDKCLSDEEVIGELSKDTEKEANCPPVDRNLGAERMDEKFKEHFKQNSSMWRMHSDTENEASPAVKLAAQRLVEKHFPEVDILDKEHWEHEEPEEKNKDLTGKYMAGVLEDFLPALKEIAKLGSMNNKPFGKYDRGSWQLVKDGEVYYQDAMWRHILDGRFNIDPTTGLPNDIAIAWNNLALICFRLKREAKEKASHDASRSTDGGA